MNGPTMPLGERPLVSVCIPTRNRREDVLRALGSCFAQDYRPLEVLVLDDGSEDGTAEAVSRDYPEIRLFRFEGHRGAAALRNFGFREARGDVVVGLDDDAYYASSRTLSQMVADFQACPGAAVIAMPFVEPLREGAGLIHGDASIGRFSPLRTYTGCANAIKRAAALQVGGYQELFFNRIIDRDLSLRLLGAGFPIVYGSSDPVIHLYSPRRDWQAQYPLSVRNSFLFDWTLVPQPYLLPRMMLDAVRLTAYKLEWRRLFQRLGYVAQGFAFSMRHWRLRRPVSLKAYRRFLALPAHGPLPSRGEPPPPVR
jgi:glycosyltransferase involved in cell wall biosynthesis